MKKLYRSSNRILAILSVFSAAFPGLLLYLILMVLIPNFDQI